MRISAAIALLVVTACGTTGEQIVTFRAAGAGPVDIAAPAEFTSDEGYHVILNEAKLNIGALYLNQSITALGANPTDCVLPGTYVGQVTQGAEIDLLSPALQYLPVEGQGTTLPALAGEVWYIRRAPGPDGSASEVDVNDTKAVSQVLTLTGIADQSGMVFPFTATITIGPNRVIPSPLPAEPGLKPICKLRIVSPIPVDITLGGRGTLIVRVDPRTFFNGVLFSTLAPSMDPSMYAFTDKSSIDQASTQLFNQLTTHGGPSSGGPYSFVWEP